MKLLDTVGGARHRRLAVFLLVVAVVVRLGYVAATPGYTPTHDDRVYDHLAVGVADTGAYPSANGRATAYRPPGYPYALGGLYALTGARGHDRIVIARVAQALLGAATVLLLGLLAATLMDPPAGLWAMALSALYVPLIALGGSLLSEPLFVALVLAALLAALHAGRTQDRRWTLAAGAIGGALSLTRANGVVVLVALTAGVCAAGRDHDGHRPAGRRGVVARLAPALVMLAAAATVVAPWTLRNASVMHAFISVSDEAGGTLAGTYNPVSDRDARAPASWRLLSEIPDYAARGAVAAATSEPELQRQLRDLALRYVRDHPAYPLKVAAYNGLRLLDLGGLSRARFTAGTAGIGSPLAADAGVVCFWLLALLALAGATTRRARAIPPVVWLVGALLLVSTVLVTTETPRFRAPLDPFVILLASAALATLARRLRGRLWGSDYVQGSEPSPLPTGAL